MPEMCFPHGARRGRTGEASNYLMSIVATHDRQRLTGAANMTRHSDPGLDALLRCGSSTMDDEAVWREAVATCAGQVPMIQIVQYINTWAHRRGLRARPAHGRAHPRHGHPPGGALKLPTEPLCGGTEWA